MSIEDKIKRKLDNFFGKYKALNLKKGSIFLTPGEPVDFIWYIRSGYVRMYTTNEYGREITVPFFKSMLCFTMLMAKTEAKNKFYFEALTAAEVYKVPKDKVMAFFEENPEINDEVTKSISSSFLGVVEEMGTLLSGTAYNKVAATLKSMITKTDFPITHKLIASVTGLTRETVTLQLLKLEKEKIIAKDRRKIKVVNENKLLRAIRE